MKEEEVWREANHMPGKNIVILICQRKSQSIGRTKYTLVETSPNETRKRKGC